MSDTKYITFKYELRSKLTNREIDYLGKHYVPKSKGMDQKSVEGTAEQLIEKYKDYVF